MLGLFDGLGWTAVAAAIVAKVDAVCVEMDPLQTAIAYSRVITLMYEMDQH